MNTLKTAALALLASSLATGAISMPAGKFKGGQYMGQVKVTLAQARATALQARAGTITDQELEKEKGGSGLRYSFDVKAAGRTYEVGVDAKTGAVLENAAEGKNPD